MRVIERFEEHINVRYGGPGPFAERVLGLVEQVDDEGLSGQKKRKTVLDALAKEADLALMWPKTPEGAALELVDGPVIRVLLGLMVEVAVQAVKRRKARAAAHADGARTPALEGARSPALTTLPPEK